MSSEITIQSHRGLYKVCINPSRDIDLDLLFDDRCHFIVDANISRLYKEQLSGILGGNKAILIDPLENNKSLEALTGVITQLVDHKLRRSNILVAIGGGITQDITCFIASTILRGVEWQFVPTTLLSQADSCIGSKSSINVNGMKNILGSFNPPSTVFIFPSFLKTLSQVDLRSGVGEIIKVHAIDGKYSLEKLTQNYELIFQNQSLMQEFIEASLLIKKRFIEVDEFDSGIRRIFNYGHSFGHAIESASNYQVPHGIAVSMGMEIANYISMARGMLPKEQYKKMQGMLQKNYYESRGNIISAEKLLNGLLNDKKNTESNLVLVLPVGQDAEIRCVEIAPDKIFLAQLSDALSGVFE